MPDNSNPLLRSQNATELDQFGKRLTWARLRAGYKTIAEAARVKGFHKQNLADHEAERRGVSREQLKAYADAFSVSREWLAWGTGEPGDVSLALEAITANAIPVVGTVDPRSWAWYAGESLVQGVVVCKVGGLSAMTLRGFRVETDHRHYPRGSVVIVDTTARALEHRDTLVVRLVSKVHAARYDFDEAVRAEDLEAQPLRYGPGTVDPRELSVEIVGRVVAGIIPEETRIGPIEPVQ